MIRTPTKGISGRAAIVGIGQTEFSQSSGRSERRLAVEAITAALADAAIDAGEVDGLVTFDMDSNDPASTADTLGLAPLRFFASTQYGGGGGCATVMHAAMAVATGAADVVVAYRAMNERSGVRYGQARVGRAIPAAASLSAPYGIHTAAQSFGLTIARYFHEYGVTNADIAPLAVAQRAYAARNPAARFFGRPITVDDHQQSRWIVEPVLRLFDCCLESDGAVALVITRSDRPTRHVPATIVAAAQGSGGPQMRNWYRPKISELVETRTAAAQLWAQSGLTPADIDLAILYDHFLPMVLMQIEALGFCDSGQAKHVVADGGVGIDGTLPVNTFGGMTGEAYLHGMNGIAEAVRQLRGTAISQVRDAEHVLATSGPGVPTSALILRRG